jgi:hypothetical protein
MQQEVLVHDKEGLHLELSFHLLHDFKQLVPLSKKLTKFPLPPKKADVVQKLQPMGQPTDGMIVAAVAPLCSGKRTPMMRVRMPETMAGCRMGPFRSSPR